MLGLVKDHHHLLFLHSIPSLPFPPLVSSILHSPPTISFTDCGVFSGVHGRSATWRTFWSPNWHRRQMKRACCLPGFVIGGSRIFLLTAFNALPKTLVPHLVGGSLTAHLAFPHGQQRSLRASPRWSRAGRYAACWAFGAGRCPTSELPRSMPYFPWSSTQPLN